MDKMDLENKIVEDVKKDPLKKYILLLLNSNDKDHIKGKTKFMKELFFISKNIKPLENEADFEADCSCECFVSQMINSLKLGAPTISHHIKELENAGLITTERKGKYLSAKVKKETLAEVSKIFNDKLKNQLFFYN